MLARGRWETKKSLLSEVFLPKSFLLFERVLQAFRILCFFRTMWLTENIFFTEFLFFIGNFLWGNFFRVMRMTSLTIFRSYRISHSWWKRPSFFRRPFFDFFREKCFIRVKGTLSLPSMFSTKKNRLTSSRIFVTTMRLLRKKNFTEKFLFSKKCFLMFPVG